MQDFPERTLRWRNDHTSLFTNQFAATLSHLVFRLWEGFHTATDTGEWLDILTRHDFSGAKVHLISSVPGTFRTPPPAVRSAMAFARTAQTSLLGSLTVRVMGMSYRDPSMLPILCRVLGIATDEDDDDDLSSHATNWTDSQASLPCRGTVSVQWDKRNKVSKHAMGMQWMAGDCPLYVHVSFTVLCCWLAEVRVSTAADDSVQYSVGYVPDPVSAYLWYFIVHARNVCMVSPQPPARALFLFACAGRWSSVASSPSPHAARRLTNRLAG